MTSLSLENLRKLYNQTMAQADPRCDSYPFMDSPDKMLAMIGLYLFIVWQGPKLMVPYKPWDLKNTIIGYNFAMVILSLYISVGTVVGIYKAGGYSVLCDSLDKYQVNENNETEYHYMNIGWLFFISKPIEFFDTVFFILRKKNSQITFLHVYHHATMTVFTWLGLKFLPGGTNVIYPLINSFVHAVMYTYYGLSACGPSMRKYLWWKKYLTKLQISQFVIFLTQGVINVMYDCPFPKIFVYAVYIYTFSILLLFINFYVKAYIKSPSQKPLKGTNAAKNGSAQNGEAIACAQNGEAVGHVNNGEAIARAKNGGAITRAKNGEAKARAKNGEISAKGDSKKIK
uniref:Elongation of very long chain fatty acids protein n=1 Tax=Arion vulgaris TaxID=1028688 RepID=A0A0B6ZA56_9EUPU